MREKKKYLSGRIRLCALVGLALFLAALGYLWYTVLDRGRGLLAGSMLTLALAGYLYLVFRLVMQPYQETRKI